MVKTFEGKVRATKDARVAIVVSRFNGFITEPLLAGAVATLEEHRIRPDAITVHWVPGAFEIPVAANRIAIKRQEFGGFGGADAIVCLGALIRGDTPHFEYISAEVTRGLGSIALDHDMPVAYGVLTCDTVEQARQRSGDNAANKGREAAAAALEMLDLFQSMDEEC